MSSILDALKKVEKGKRSRTRGAGDLPSMIITPEPPPTRRLGWRAVIALTLISALAGGGTVWLLSGRRPASAPPPAPVSTAAPSLVTPSPPPAADRTTSPPPSPPSPVTRRVKQERVLPSPPPPRAAAPVEPRRIQPVPVQEPQPPVAATPSLPEPAQPAPRGAGKPFRVSGIGWQKDASLRYAVINGSAVAEGGVVDGATVREIRQDRVVIERDGQTVEVPFEK